MENIYNVLKIPQILSEKATKLREKQNKYTFIVDKAANKIQIKRVVEEIYKVKVKKINISYVRGKKRIIRDRKRIGYTPELKKAIVTLFEGYSISMGI